MRRKVIPILMLLLSLVTVSFADKNRQAALALALDLEADELHNLSALEFRRCSYICTENQADDKSGFLAAAAWEYLAANELELSIKMLDQAEIASSKVRAYSLLLRGEIELERRNLSESSFFLSTLQQSSDAPEKYKAVAAARLAIVDLRKKDLQNADRHLRSISADKSLEALNALEAGRNRSPRLGGVLGIIPGLGYAYSGEYANALRSLILNGIFIYAMTDTADREQWGAFTALTFFELTWYTGSIYGGIDAAHRFNKHREDIVVDAIRSEYNYELDLEAVPSITLEFSF